MVCSPQFFHHLSQGGRGNVQMHKGMFFSDTVVNSIIAPKFVPVFLNDCIPRQPKEWLPPQLHAARHFWLGNLRELFQDIQAQEYTELERNQVLAQKLTDPKHKEMANLLRYLREVPEVVPPAPPQVPVQLPPRSPHSSPLAQRHVAGEYPIIHVGWFLKWEEGKVLQEHSSEASTPQKGPTNEAWGQQISLVQRRLGP